MALSLRSALLPGSAIKRIQRGLASIDSDVPNRVVTISACDMNKSVLTISGHNSTSLETSDGPAYISSRSVAGNLISQTEIIFFANFDSDINQNKIDHSTFCFWQLVEYN